MGSYNMWASLCQYVTTPPLPARCTPDCDPRTVLLQQSRTSREDWHVLASAWNVHLVYIDVYHHWITFGQGWIWWQKMAEAGGLAEELYSYLAEAEYRPNIYNCPHLSVEAELWSTSNYNYICFDTVGWASGRASSLLKIEWCDAGMVICVEWCTDDLHMDQLMSLTPRHLLLR